MSAQQLNPSTADLITVLRDACLTIRQAKQVRKKPNKDKYAVPENALESELNRAVEELQRVFLECMDDDERVYFFDDITESRIRSIRDDALEIKAAIRATINIDPKMGVRDPEEKRQKVEKIKYAARKALEDYRLQLLREARRAQTSVSAISPGVNVPTGSSTTPRTNQYSGQQTNEFSSNPNSPEPPPPQYVEFLSATQAADGQSGHHSTIPNVDAQPTISGWNSNQHPTTQQRSMNTSQSPYRASELNRRPTIEPDRDMIPEAVSRTSTNSTMHSQNIPISPVRGNTLDHMRSLSTSMSPPQPSNMATSPPERIHPRSFSIATPTAQHITNDASGRPSNRLGVMTTFMRRSSTASQTTQLSTGSDSSQHNQHSSPNSFLSGGTSNTSVSQSPPSASGDPRRPSFTSSNNAMRPSFSSPSSSTTTSPRPTSSSKPHRVSTTAIEFVPGRKITGAPCKGNEWWGFCKGAWDIQSGLPKSLFVGTTVLGILGSSYRRYIQCSASGCTFQGPQMSGTINTNTNNLNHPTKKSPKVNPDKTPLPDQRVYTHSATGIQFRWLFLAKSHHKCTERDTSKVINPFAQKYGCIFCVAKGDWSPSLMGVDSLMNHILRFHTGAGGAGGSAGFAGSAIETASAGGECMTADTARRNNVILGRKADNSEEFDINIPVSYEERLETGQGQGQGQGQEVAEMDSLTEEVGAVEIGDGRRGMGSRTFYIAEMEG